MNRQWNLPLGCAMNFYLRLLQRYSDLLVPLSNGKEQVYEDHLAQR
jgi:hypothetical protein